MSDFAAIPQAIAEAPEPSAEERARRKAAYEELAEIGMGLIRALSPGRSAEIDPEAEEARLHLARLNIAAFAAAGRIVCQAMREAARGDEPPPTRRREAAMPTLARDLDFDREFRLAVARARAAKRERVRELIVEAAEAEIDDAGTLEDYANAIDERLEESFACGDVADQPMREIVEALCAEIGLKPDWTCWDGSGWSLPVRPSAASSAHTASGLTHRPLNGAGGRPARADTS